MQRMNTGRGFKWLFRDMWCFNKGNNVQTDRSVLLDENCCLLRRIIKGFLKTAHGQLKSRIIVTADLKHMQLVSETQLIL